MTPDDKPALMEISSRIWEGTDYLPLVFDDWVRDTHGEFAAVELDGALVGCAKLTFLTDTDAWLEGMRKDPRVTEKGLALAVGKYFLERLANRADLTSVRFSTYFANAASIRANERNGFRLRTVLSIKKWEGSVETLPHVAPGAARAEVHHDAGPVLAFLERSGYFIAADLLVVEGWRSYPFTPGLIGERYVKSGQCRAVMSGTGCVGAAAWNAETRAGATTVKLVFLDAEDDSTADVLFGALIRAVRDEMTGAAARTGSLEWMIPDLARLKRWAKRWGLASYEQENDFFVYELPRELPRTAPRGPEAERSGRPS